MQAIDLTGQKYGRLTAIRKIENSKWLCECECGKQVEVFTSNLRRGHTKSCGCYREETRSNNRAVDLTGRKFHRLMVLERRPGAITEYLCRCDCGKEVVVRGGNLTSGNTKSCGCLLEEKSHEPKKVKHGLSKTRLFSIWSGMKLRCYRKKDKAWKWYGGKGITVCGEWLNDFGEFYKWAMDNGYKDGLTIDRIDHEGNYTPDNCRWATIKEQQNNRSSNKNITYNGETKTVKQWSEQYGIPHHVILWRLKHWSELDDVFMRAVQRRKPREV